MIVSLVAGKALDMIGEYLAKKAGEKVMDKLTEKLTEDAYTGVKGLIKGKPEAETALQAYEAQQSAETRSKLEELLTQLLERDPNQAQRLEQVVNNYTQVIGDQVGTKIVYQGVPVEEYKKVVKEHTITEVKLDAITEQFEIVKQELANKDAELLQTQQLSAEEINRLKAELETERNKKNFSEEIKETLNELDARNDFAAAEALLRERVARKQQKELADTYFQMAGYAKLQLKYRDALAHYEEAIRLDPDNTLYLNEAGLMMNTLGFHKGAIALYERALPLDIAVEGEESGKVAVRYNNLGAAWDSLGDYHKAIDYYEKALTIDLTLYGDKHPQVAIYNNNLGGAWDSLGEYHKAIDYYEKALVIDLAVYGDKHPRVATRYNNLGEAWRALCEYHKAIDYYEKSLVILEKTFGENHPNVATLNNNLGVAYFYLKDKDKAISYMEKALHISETMYSDGQHPDIKLYRENLDYLRTL